MEEKQTIEVFGGRRFVVALLIALGVCGSVLGLYFAAVLLAYGQEKALDSMAKHAAWILRLTACFLFPLVLFALERKSRARQKAKNEAA